MQQVGVDKVPNIVPVKGLLVLLNHVTYQVDDVPVDVANAWVQVMVARWL